MYYNFVYDMLFLVCLSFFLFAIAGWSLSTISNYARLITLRNLRTCNDGNHTCIASNAS